MKVRASDLLDFSLALLGPEYAEWCLAAILLWKSDQQLQQEFADILLFFDWAFEVAEKLIRSAEDF